jgi:serine/threonine-protein kinase HSL1 (negative regulator of Swe1 kinase)
LENYTPDLGYSSSDYHHVKPLALQKTYSTCHFPQAKSKGHGRQISRFTVISNVAETEQSYDPFKASRPQHLDSTRPADRAKIIIHRKRSGNQEEDDKQDSKAARARQSSRTSASMVKGPGRGRQQKLAPPRVFASRSSLASSTRSRSSAHMRASVGHKRGVSFSHIRKGSGSSLRKASVDVKSNAAAGRHSNHTEVTDDGGDTLRAVRETPSSTRYIRSRKAQLSPTEPFLAAPKSSRASQLWTDDVRQLSTNLAKDCDEAFNRSSVISEVETLNKAQLSDVQSSSSERKPGSKQQFPAGGQLTTVKTKHPSLDSRPLPPPPARSESVNIELIEARKHAEIRKLFGGDESPGYLDRMVSHIDRLIQPSSPTQSHVNRRASSAPVDTKHAASARPLPSIHEAYGEEASPRRNTDFHKFTERKSSRVASAPEPRASNRNHYDDRFTRPDSNVRDTIRVVQPSSPGSPVKPPAPLTIRKKSSQGGPQTPITKSDHSSNSSRRRPSGLELRQQYQAGSKLDVTTDLGRIDEDYHNNDDQFANDSNSGTIVKKAGWFKRNSKLGEDDFQIPPRPGNPLSSQLSDTMRPHLDAPLPMPPKKKGFSFGKLFKKRSSRPDMTVTCEYKVPLPCTNLLANPAANDIFDDDASVQDSIAEAQRQSHAGRYANQDDPRARQIEPQRNWLAKLFNVKPASKFICFSVSKRRARQEITTILKDWKRYGIRDVQVDKERNIVFGKVAAQNCRSLETLLNSIPANMLNRSRYERSCFRGRDHDCH